MAHEELIRRYEKGIDVFEKALAGVPESKLDTPRAPGKWTIRQIAIHVTDSEVVGLARFRTIAAEPGKTIKAYDQEKWTSNLHYEKQPLKESVELFRAGRKQTAAMLRALPESAWKNTAVHEESGEQRLDKFLEHYCEHVENHAKQIMETRQKLGLAAKA